MKTGLDFIIAKKLGITGYEDKYGLASLAMRNLFGGVKNLFYRTYERTETVNGITFWWDKENQEIVMNGTYLQSGDLKLVNPFYIDWEIGEYYTVSVIPVSGSAYLPENASGSTFGWGIFRDNATDFIRGQLHYLDLNVPYVFTDQAFSLDGRNNYIFYFQCWKPGTVFNDYRVKVQIEKGKEAHAWTPYKA